MSWIEQPAVDTFRNVRLSKLSMDRAYVYVTSHVGIPLWVYTLSEDCYKCPYSRLSRVDDLQHPLEISTTRSSTWRVLTDGSLNLLAENNYSSVVCEFQTNFGEFGVYDLDVKPTNSTIHCSVQTSVPPVNIYLPMLLCILGLIAIWLLLTAASCIASKVFPSRTPIVPTSQPVGPSTPSSPQQQKGRQRLKSLDTFRGISIVLMIFVNYGAGGYWWLEHSTWNGLYVADLLFPWFMWIMGVCIPISVRSQLKKNVSRCTMIAHVLKRSCILFLLGLTLNTLGEGSILEKIRIMGVLQRFGIVYLVAATMSITFTCRSFNPSKMKAVNILQDVIELLPQWILVVAITAGYCVLIFVFQVPGCPVGYLGPGGIQYDEKFRGCTGGATGYIDRLIMGMSHVYPNPTANTVYDSGPFDPEGFVGCLPSLLQVFLGVQAGTTLSIFPGWKQRVIRWLSWGSVSGIVAAILCCASKENGWIPINKNLWSLSFVLTTSCFAFFLLCACYVLIDVKHFWSGAPFYFPGMNSTIMYVGHDLCYNLFPFHWALGPMNTHFLRLIECLWGTALWVLVAVWLHRIKFFLSL